MDFPNQTSGTEEDAMSSSSLDMDDPMDLVDAVLLFADGLSDSADIVLVFELVDFVLMSDNMPHFLMLFALLAIIPPPSIIQFSFFIVK
jgi:hypothetical protein